MIKLTGHVPLFVFHDSIDFRCGIDKLAALSGQVSGEDPKDGTVFVFRNRLLTAAKLLVYDGSGFWMCHKRLSTGKFSWWPDGKRDLHHEELILLLEGASSCQMDFKPWRRIKTIRDVKEKEKNSTNL